MFQRLVDFYHSLSDTTAVDQLLDHVGFGRALQTGLKNRLTRPDNLLRLAN